MALAIRIVPTLRRLALSGSNVQICGSRRALSTRSPLFVKKYTSDHEWFELDEGGKTGYFGISKYAADALGDVVYVELPKEGDEFRKGDTVGAVESVKSASDINAPVSGKVIETNTTLEETPGQINKDPEGNAWLAKIEVTDAAELDTLHSKEDYDALEKDGDH